MSKQVNVQSVKGIPDVLPKQIALWHQIEQHIQQLMRQYSYTEIRLPVVEKTALFARSIGEHTDVVEKEMFTFDDRNKVPLSLRPEGTAGCVRAGLEHGLLRNQQHQRLWYYGPMFRYEQPQEGRYRQFYQLGVEAFGFRGQQIECEQIAMVARLIQALKINDVVQLEINTIGTSEERAEYRKQLVSYLQQHETILDEDSKRRLHTNPLRILDSKNPDMQALIERAPKLQQHLSVESLQAYASCKQFLQALGIEFKENPCLVRGLDYYHGLVYEWTSPLLGAQSTFCAGGRYDNLIQQLGGEATYGVGFAMGVERLLLILKKQNTQVAAEAPDGYLISVGEAAEAKILHIAEKIRNACPMFKLQANFSQASFKNQFKKADRSGATIAIILGEEELVNDTLSIKYLREDKPQTQLLQSDLADLLGDVCKN